MERNEFQQYLIDLGIADTRVADIDKGIDELHKALCKLDFNGLGVIKKMGGVAKLLNNWAELTPMARNVQNDIENKV